MQRPSLADAFANIPLPPTDPTLEQVDRDISHLLSSLPDDNDPTDPDDYTALTSTLKLLSIRKKIEILELPLELGTKHFGHILRAQASLAQGTENSVVRADEGVMRARTAESLIPALLETIQREKARLLALEPQRQPTARPA